MYIIPKFPDQLSVIWTALQARINASRFTANLDYVMVGGGAVRKTAIKMRVIRLRQRKHYCGQHPNECQVVLLGNGEVLKKTHMRSTILEGADWVGFNDMLNDLLDELQIDANVYSYNREAADQVYDPRTGKERMRSGKYYIRKGRCRRLDYQSDCITRGQNTFYHWVMAGEHADYCGKIAPRSWFPEGTPGLAEWRPNTPEEIALSNHSH